MTITYNTNNTSSTINITEINESFELLVRLFPKFVESVRDLVYHDIMIHDKFDEIYGVDTIENLEKTREYDREFDNITQNLPLQNTDVSYYARTRKHYFDVYTLESYKVVRKIGAENALHSIDLLENFFKYFSEYQKEQFKY